LTFVVHWQTVRSMAPVADEQGWPATCFVC